MSMGYIESLKYTHGHWESLRRLKWNLNVGPLIDRFDSVNFSYSSTFFIELHLSCTFTICIGSHFEPAQCIFKSTTVLFDARCLPFSPIPPFPLFNTCTVLLTSYTNLLQILAYFILSFQLYYIPQPLVRDWCNQSHSKILAILPWFYILQQWPRHSNHSIHKTDGAEEAKATP